MYAIGRENRGCLGGGSTVAGKRRLFLDEWHRFCGQWTSFRFADCQLVTLWAAFIKISAFSILSCPEGHFTDDQQSKRTWWAFSVTIQCQMPDWRINEGFQNNSADFLRLKSCPVRENRGNRSRNVFFSHRCYSHLQEVVNYWGIQVPLRITGKNR